jgi:cation transport protein ChaC
MVETEQGPLRAIAFVINHQPRFYTGWLPPEQVADVLARACGHWGSCAEYLHNTVVPLEEQGTRDRNLWRLQAPEVAGRIKPDASDPAKPMVLEGS